MDVHRLGGCVAVVRQSWVGHGACVVRVCCKCESWDTRRAIVGQCCGNRVKIFGNRREIVEKAWVNRGKVVERSREGSGTSVVSA